MQRAVVYSDKLVKVYENGIRFLNYYFPFISKFVEFSNIVSVEKRALIFQNGKWRLWGTTDFITWFPLDWRRPQRDSIFSLRLNSQRMRIGFTVEDSGRFVDLMESKGISVENIH